MSSLSLINPPPCASWKSASTVGRKQVRRTSINCTNDFGAKSFFLNPSDERILKQALKGFLRLDLNEDPLKEWVTRTVEASGITQEDEENIQPQQESPQQIEIE